MKQKIKLKLIVGNFSFFITIHKTLVFADKNSGISVSIQNVAYIHNNVFLSQ